MTKICIFGAGSIGGFIATSLKKTNAQVSLIARGEHKKAIEQNGLTYSFITIRKFIIFQFPLNKLCTFINRRILIPALTPLSNPICQGKSYFCSKHIYQSG